MNTVWHHYLGWIVAGSLLGFAISVIFAGILHLPRRIFLVRYIGIMSLFFYAYVRWSELSIADMLKHNWVWGVLGALVLGVITIRSVLSQPASPHSQGFTLAVDLLWSGFLYGLVDALLLSVLPVLATWEAFDLLGWPASAPGRIVVALLAILASMLVTSAYQVGYPDFRGRRLITANVGNTFMTLGYLLTSNPLAAMLCHPAMHMAAVLHGPELVTQSPPHYQT